MTRVGWANSIANMPTPTAAELTAGMRLDLTMTSDGLVGFKPNTSRVSNAKFSSKFNTTRAGRIEFSDALLRLFKQDGTDTVWNTFVYRTLGFVAVRHGLDAGTAWLAGQKVDIFAVEHGQRSRLDKEPNTYDRWESPLAFYTDPVFEATIA
jgi:hypothetical protein